MQTQRAMNAKVAFGGSSVSRASVVPMQRPRCTRASTRTFAKTEQSEFKTNLGFVETDSGGKSNIFAVEPTVYVDSANSGTATALTLVAILSSVGVVGSLYLESKNPVDADLTELYESGNSISAYATKFEAKLPKKAPIVVAAPAPAPEIVPEVVAEVSVAEPAAVASE